MQADQGARPIILHRLRRIGLVALFVSVPIAAALVAVRVAPPAHVEIAGAPVAVKPVLGQDTSRLQGGALVRPEHAHVGGPGLLGMDVGADISADWNRLIPTDKQTRQYLVALWDDPEPEIDRIQRAARAWLVEWTLIGLFAGAAAAGGVALLIRERRRRLATYSDRDAALVTAYNRRLRIGLVSAAVVGALLLDVAGVASYLDRDHHVVASSPLLAGTTLQGTEVNGLIGRVLPFLSILRPRDTFYDTVASNLETALANRDDLEPHGDTMTLVLAEDFEDVNGMARQVGLAAHLVDADFIALSGDLTFAGKPLESYIIDTVDYYSERTPVYFAPGQHDTTAIVDAARGRGWHVGEGHTESISGLALLSAADPRISLVGDFGVGDVLRDPDIDLETFLDNTTSEACATRPDFVLLHDHVLGQQIAASGCAKVAVLDGRSYSFLGPRPVQTTTGGTAWELTNGSAGGHTSTAPDPGDIQHPAHFAILTYSRDRERARYAVVTVNPDASVTVTRRASLHTPYADIADAAAAGGSVGDAAPLS
jgi:hypothetical protein